MEYNINSILQNKGFIPNKKMSSTTYTAYNIDMYGEETIFDNLIINNSKNTWFDKANNQGGNIYYLVKSMKFIDETDTAKSFLDRFVSFIEPWISDVSKKPVEDSKLIHYHERMMNHIYHLQTFAVMVSHHFDNNRLGFGKYFIEEFKFNDFLRDENFMAYLNEFLSMEKFKIQQNIEEFTKYKDSLNQFKFGKRAKRVIKKKVKPIKKKGELTKLEWNKTISKMIKELGDNPDPKTILHINKYRK